MFGERDGRGGDDTASTPYDKGRRTTLGAITAASHLTEVVDAQCVCSESGTVEVGMVQLRRRFKNRGDHGVLLVRHKVPGCPAKASKEQYLPSCHLGQYHVPNLVGELVISPDPSNPSPHSVDRCRTFRKRLILGDPYTFGSPLRCLIEQLRVRLAFLSLAVSSRDFRSPSDSISGV